MPTAEGKDAAAATDGEELEPLFDYSRVQPTIAFCFDDSDLEKSDIFVHCNKRPKVADANAVEGDKADEEGAAGVKKATVVNLEEDDWLPPPPPKPAFRAGVRKDKTLEELRLKKQELAKIAEDTLQKVAETVKKDLAAKKQSEHIVLDDPPEPQVKKAREKLLITIQDKDGEQQFRIYKDEKFDKLFKVYAKKAKLNPSELTFIFDGNKISPASTLQDLDLEDDDMIEVRHNPR